jgi:hypothetical protein
VGHAVATVDGVEPASTDALSGTVTKDVSVLIRFVRPIPPASHHGSARKAIHKPITYKMLAEQREWLEENAVGK